MKNFFLVLHRISSKWTFFVSNGIDKEMNCSFSHHRANHSSTNDLINSSNEENSLAENAHNRRVHSLVLTSKSTQNSPRHYQSLLTPTNPDQSEINATNKFFSSMLFLSSDSPSFLSVSIRFE